MIKNELKIPIMKAEKENGETSVKVQISTLRITVSTVISFFSFLLFFSALWGISNIANIDLNSIVYYISGNTEGSDSNLIRKYLFEALLPAMIFTAVYFTLFFVFGTHSFDLKKDGRFRKLLKKVFPIPGVRFVSMIMSIVLLTGSLIYFAVCYNVSAFFSNITDQSSLIEDNYIAPENAEIKFPENKRNLIYIFAESVENTYFSEENGGLLGVMPELEQLALENINFSNNDKLGGARQYDSTNWTVAGMTAQTSGIPLKSSLKRNLYGKETPFLQGAYSLGQVLENEGYKNYLMIGSNKSFANRDNYFSQHGNYEIYDLNSAIEDGIVEKENDFWGYEDRVLFDLAKKQLTKISKDDSTPFNYTILTVDTHYPYGWNCPDCPNQVYEANGESEAAEYAQYKNAMACSSKKISDFVNWIKKQDFYENTTIIISGDHLSMSKLIDNDAEEKNYDRTTVNIFINAAAEPKNTKNREFGTFDMYPTTLAALGCNIEGERLGLGTNLFSDIPTLAEKFGYEDLNSKLGKQSMFYVQRILGGVEETED